MYSSFAFVAVLRRHIDTKEKAQKASEIILGFRQYLTYHIKCSKAFFHQRMRAQVTSLLQVRVACVLGVEFPRFIMQPRHLWYSQALISV